MKKIIKIKNIFVFMMVGLLIGLPIRASLVYAEDTGVVNNKDVQNKDVQNKDSNKDDNKNEKDNKNKNKNKNENENENKNKNENENENENEDGQNNDEHDVFSLLVADSQKSSLVTLPVIDEKTIVTYADVVTLLKSYESAVSQISANAGVDTSDSNLTASEKVLLNGLLNKHQNQFNRFDSRITEVNTQLKQLEDLLTPLGTEPVSSQYGIKGLLINELNNFREIISRIGEFDNLNRQVLQGETD